MQQHLRCLVLREEISRPSLGDDDLGARVGEDRGQAFPGIRRIERHVGAAGLEDAEQHDDHVGRSLQTHADQHLGSHAERLQEVSHSVGATIELPVGESLRAMDHRDRIRSAIHLRLDQLVQTHRRIGPGGLVPSDDNLMALRLGHQRQIANAGLEIQRHGFEQDEEVLVETFDGLPIEEILAELRPEANLSAEVRQEELEVESRPAAWDLLEGGDDAWQLETRTRGRQEAQPDRRKRVMAERTLGSECPYNALEWHVLVRQRLE